jgi:hypothetical protein
MPTKVKKPKLKKRAIATPAPIHTKPELRVRITHHRFDRRNIHGYWCVSVAQHPIKYITLETENPHELLVSTHGPKMLAQFQYVDDAVSAAASFVAAALRYQPNAYTIVWEGPH